MCDYLPYFPPLNTVVARSLWANFSLATKSESDIFSSELVCKGGRRKEVKAKGLTKNSRSSFQAMGTTFNLNAPVRFVGFLFLFFFNIDLIDSYLEHPGVLSYCFFIHPPPHTITLFFKTDRQLLIHSKLIKWSMLINVTLSPNHDFVNQSRKSSTVF